MNLITYQLSGESGSEASFEVDIERPERMAEQNSESHPEWTELGNNQCPNCPFSCEAYRYCPAAIEIEEIANRFADTTSIERIDVWVHTAERSFFKNVDMQSALKSLFGLIMASGPCPILSRLKPLAHFHLPFATLQETIHRLVGTYLINQYLHHNEGKESDWDLKGIEGLYHELKQVNLHLMKRIRLASKKDASINAIQTFISITSIVEMGVDDIVEKMVPILRKGL
jgi:hypothetical protein